VKPKRNREIISGIAHILKVGGRLRDRPEDKAAYKDRNVNRARVLALERLAPGRNTI
jgi:hypothetical protein